MPAKQKVTLYISDDLHRQFKIRAAVDGETMSSMAQRALEFYLDHAEVVEGTGEGYGRTHLVHACPKCSAAVTLKGDDLILARDGGDVQVGDLAGLERLADLGELGLDSEEADGGERSPDEGELITC